MYILNNIKKIMTSKNITIDALAQKTNLSVGTIKRARTNQITDCRFSTLIAIADALEVQVKDLFDESDTKAGLQISKDTILEGLEHGALVQKMRQIAGMETASETAKRLQDEQAELLRKVAESAAYNAIIEFERKLKAQREEHEEAIKKAGIPPVGSIF